MYNGFVRRMSVLFQIFKMEVLLQLRDRHALLYAVILPIGLYPLLLFGLLQLASISEGLESRSRVRVSLRESSASPLRPFLERQEGLLIVPEKGQGDTGESALTQVRSGLMDAVVTVSDQDKNRSARVYYDGSSDRSEIAMNRISGLLEEFKLRTVAQALSSLGLRPKDILGLDISEESIASPERMGQFALSLLLPGMLLLVATMGASYPSIDVTVGERERQTYETSLLLPVDRWVLVSGKFLAVVSMAMGAVLLNLTSMSLSVQHIVAVMKVNALDVLLRPGQLALLLLVCGLFATFISSLMILIASRATHLSEAQSLVAPLYLVSVLPGAVASIPGIHLSTHTALIPLVNAVLCFKAILSRDIPWGPFGLSLAVMALLALAGVWLTSRVFGKEDLRGCLRPNA